MADPRLGMDFPASQASSAGDGAVMHQTQGWPCSGVCRGLFSRRRVVRMGHPLLSMPPEETDVAMVPSLPLLIQKEMKEKRKDDPFFSPGLLSPPPRLLL